ncbi:CocE/NonD family hydrolase, partial [Nocardioides massiliensis]
MSLRTALVPVIGAAIGTVLVSSLLVAPPVSAAPAVSVANRCIDSAPEPGSKRPVKICFTVFKPAGASAKRPVPVLLEGHGWAGKRQTSPAAVKRWTDAGYGVVSIDQRGFGQSGGLSHVMHPAYEGKDLRRIVNTIARYRWVQKDGPRDPRMGTIGGSYGGGYQFLAAFELLRARGKPVIDAMAPQITWHDLNRSLAPNGVVRTLWAAVLVGAGLPSNALPPHIYKGLVEGLATGTWPQGQLPLMEDLRPFFTRNGPSWHVRQGRKLDIPMLLGQGTTDGLFNLQEGLRNWRTVLTRRARQQSVFVGYNGGHVLPAL